VPEESDPGSIPHRDSSAIGRYRFVAILEPREPAEGRNRAKCVRKAFARASDRRPSARSGGRLSWCSPPPNHRHHRHLRHPVRQPARPGRRHIRLGATRGFVTRRVIGPGARPHTHRRVRHGVPLDVHMAEHFGLHPARHPGGSKKSCEATSGARTAWGGGWSHRGRVFARPDRARGAIARSEASILTAGGTRGE
jgi:hypothetical protein